MAANSQIPPRCGVLQPTQASCWSTWIPPESAAVPIRKCCSRYLNALGAPIGQARDAARLLRSRHSARVERIVEPVTVLDDTSLGRVLVSLRAPDTDLECAIDSEEGERVEWRIRRDDLVSLSSERVDGRDIYRGAIPLPALLRCGYHNFTVLVGVVSAGQRSLSRRWPAPGALWRGLACLWDLCAAVLTALCPQLGLR